MCLSQSPPQLTKEEAIKLLWNQGKLYWKLHKAQKAMYDMVKKSDHPVIVIGCSRQLGKCLAEGTPVLTPSGLIPIEKLQIGDKVYGYNSDGSISLSKVRQTFNSGIKEVVDLTHRGVTWTTSSLDHEWLVTEDQGATWKEKKVKDFTDNSSIKRVNLEGTINPEPDYVLDYVPIKLENKRFVQCYDISIDNDTSLYVLANGLVTHNSWFLTSYAIEQCLQNKDIIVKFIAPKAKDIRRIISPLLKQITEDAPEELKPKYNSRDNIYVFPSTGSEIQLAGTDNGHAESIRGNRAHLCIIDEAGFCDELDYVVKSILLPTMTRTGGKLIMASTPSKSPDHDFMKFFDEAESQDRLIKATIYDNPQLTESDINKIAEGLGGKDSVDFRREYLVERIISEDDAIVPEFSGANGAELQAKIIKEWPRPAFFDTYVSMDIGGKDLTALVFAYYDFLNGKIIIEDEYVAGGMVLTDEIARNVKQKESDLYKTQFGEVPAPYLRVADNNNIILLNDLTIKHGLSFVPTLKDNADAAINNMRILLRGERIIINPRCKVLISHLKGGIWNKSRTSFSRSADKGHYDMIHALVYLCRNINFNKNPYPPGYHINSTPANTFVIDHKKYENSQTVEQGVKNMFKTRKFNRFR